MNCLCEIPATIGSFSLLQELNLNGNGLEDSYICCLTTLPASLGALTNLKELHLEGNQLSSLPIEIGFLSQLQILKANNNRLSSIPSSIGDCKSLAEVVFWSPVELCIHTHFIMSGKYHFGWRTFLHACGCNI
ncbi:hypothetical protein Sjap_014194 [Stephania japonica]|uniref:Uncharacterized protein n=1 Tax=Stephania japonica TaxID=461633 RepID=A0AAP0J1D8_9MAGN